MEAAGQPLFKNIMPDAAGAIGPVANLEALVDGCDALLVTAGSVAERTIETGIEALSRDVQHLARLAHWPYMPALRDESELHVASFARNAAARFRISRFALSWATSLFRAAIMASSARCWALPGNAAAGA